MPQSCLVCAVVPPLSVGRSFQRNMLLSEKTAAKAKQVLMDNPSRIKKVVCARHSSLHISTKPPNPPPTHPQPTHPAALRCKLVGSTITRLSGVRAGTQRGLRGAWVGTSACQPCARMAQAMALMLLLCCVAL